jgi:CubicO group peptidase (beta-lactamase class C family)
MRASIGVVRDWQLVGFEADAGTMNAASLVKLVIGHLALAIVDDLDEPIHTDISTRHVLSHTTGLPNWRPEGQPLRSLRPPGTRWGYSGEGFVILQHHLELLSGRAIGDLAEEQVFAPLGMVDSRFGDPEPGFHGFRPLLTNGPDFGRFVAHVLAVHDERWRPQWRIDAELAWGAGWGLEVGPPLFGWQWGANPDAANFVMGCPATGEGVVIFTDRTDGRTFYREVVQRVLPGDHPSLRVEHNATWTSLFAQ